MFYELPKPIRTGGMVLSWFPVIGYATLPYLALLTKIQPFIANVYFFVLIYALLAWTLFYSFFHIITIFNYKKKVSNVDLGKIAKKDGTAFTVKEQEIIAHGLPEAEKPLKQLVSRNSGAIEAALINR